MCKKDILECWNSRKKTLVLGEESYRGSSKNRVNWACPSLAQKGASSSYADKIKVHQIGSYRISIDRIFLADQFGLFFKFTMWSFLISRYDF